jgi:glycosyltransferase involved in cell wall biosynthesis
MLVSLLAMRPGRIGGTETYLRRLVAELPTAAGRDEVTLLITSDLRDDPIARQIRTAVVPCTSQRMLAWRGLDAAGWFRSGRIQRLIEQQRPDVMLFPQQSIFPHAVDVPCVLVLHDLYHLAMPQHLRIWQRQFRLRSYARSLARAAQLIAISDQTRRDVIEAHGIDAVKITVVPHGVASQGPRPSIDYASRQYDAEPYLYYPAVTLPHKDHETLLATLGELRRQGRLRHRLLLSGERTRHWRSLRRRIEAQNLADVVSHQGYVSYDRVAELYRGADYVVFPSRHEGFGLPVLEAAGFARRLITSRLEVFREIGVPERCRIDFGDPEQLAAALADRRPTTLERTPISWQACAQATVAVLRRAAGRTPSPHHLPAFDAAAGLTHLYVAR